MNHAALPITYAPPQSDPSARPEIWARLEQEYKPSGRDMATPFDLYQMLARARSGKSAMTYVGDSCPYIEFGEDEAVVSLDFFVWPSSLSMQYSLKADHGEFSDGAQESVEAGFAVAVDGRDAVDLDYVLDGTLVAETPMVNGGGELVEGVELDLDGSRLTLSEPVSCALWATGQVQGLRHTLTMRFPTADGYAVKDIQNSVTLSWADEGGERQEQVEEVVFPQCVIDLLGECPDGTPRGRRPKPEEPKYRLYANDCNGLPILGRWE